MHDEKQKNDDEFIKIYMKYKTPVYFYLLSILKDAGLSEDIMQETFIRVRTNIYKYGSINNLRTWIMKIARNLALNCLRDRKFELLNYEEINANVEEAVNVDEFVTDSIMINDVLNYLSNDEREIFSLHVFGCYTHREISEILNIPQGTVRWKYSIIKKKLRKLLKKY